MTAIQPPAGLRFKAGAFLMSMAIAVGALVAPARAVIFYSSADPTMNTTAPTGTLAGSGWQYEGQWVGFTGTPVAPNYFLTAKHVGGVVGSQFNFNGINYNTVAAFADPNS